MLTNDLRRQKMKAWQEASNYHRKWMDGLVLQADKGDSYSENLLRAFLKHYRGTGRIAVAYRKVMDEQAQERLDL
jgi:hypothetical protein